MSWTDKLKAIAGTALKVTAPTLGTALGGPLAGNAMSKISEVLLGKSDATEDEVGEALTNMTPDQVVALRKLDQDYKLEMEQKKIDLKKLNLDALKDARARDVEIRKTTGGKNIRADVLAYLAVGMLAFLMFAVIWATVPAGPARDILMVVVGIVSKIVADVYAFEFNSSRGSKDKDANFQSLLDKMSK